MPRTHICAAILCAAGILGAFPNARCVAGSKRTASPGAQATPQDLLPCPYSLPCIATASAYPARHPTSGASAPMNALLPCPDSVPCAVVGNPAMRESHARDRIRPNAELQHYPAEVLKLSVIDTLESASRPAPAHHAGDAKAGENMARVRYSAIPQSPTSKASDAGLVVTMEGGASDRQKAQDQIVQAERDLARVQRYAQRARGQDVRRRAPLRARRGARDRSKTLSACRRPFSKSVEPRPQPCLSAGDWAANCRGRQRAERAQGKVAWEFRARIEAELYAVARALRLRNTARGERKPPLGRAAS